MAGADLGELATPETDDVDGRRDGPVGEHLAERPGRPRPVMR
ncbi:MAG: hypothetical protein R2713_15000 [Ilumatobacteraceae bacterium]